VRAAEVHPCWKELEEDEAITIHLRDISDEVTGSTIFRRAPKQIYPGRMMHEHIVG
jgi:hypothetical protein